MSRPPPSESARSHLFFRLLGWRLRHYADATLKLLLRRWQSVLFVLLVVSPAATPLAAQIDAVGTPIRKIVEGGSPAYALTAWLILSLLAIAWAAVQADALRGGAPWRYLRTLPRLSRFETGLDLTLLLIVDLPLLLPSPPTESLCSDPPVVVVRSMDCWPWPSVSNGPSCSSSYCVVRGPHCSLQPVR